MMEIVQGTPADDELLVRHYLAIWESYGTPRGHLLPEAAAGVLHFIDEARKHRKLGVFFAIVDKECVGSIACNLYVSPYPVVKKPEHQLDGYIWHVFVDAGHRGRGIATELVGAAKHYLASIGCTRAVLHSSDAGMGVYARAGFTLATEMRLPLR
jgi:GNAT superfamily N-acetyltransferase